MSNRNQRPGRGLLAQSLRAPGESGDAATGVPAAAEPCASCGEETAVGSVFFSDRRTVSRADGSRTYLCALCDSRIRASRKGRPLTDDEARQLAEAGSLAFLTWTGGR